MRGRIRVRVRRDGGRACLRVGGRGSRGRCGGKRVVRQREIRRANATGPDMRSRDTALASPTRQSRSTASCPFTYVLAVGGPCVRTYSSNAYPFAALVLLFADLSTILCEWVGVRANVRACVRAHARICTCSRALCVRACVRACICE